MVPRKEARRDPGCLSLGVLLISAQPLEHDVAPEERGRGQLQASPPGASPRPHAGGHSLRSPPAKALSISPPPFVVAG